MKLGKETQAVSGSGEAGVGWFLSDKEDETGINYLGDCWTCSVSLEVRVGCRTDSELSHRHFSLGGHLPPCGAKIQNGLGTLQLDARNSWTVSCTNSACPIFQPATMQTRFMLLNFLFCTPVTARLYCHVYFTGPL